MQNNAYVALWQDAINKQNNEQPDEVEVHWGPTDDKLTKKNLTIVEGEGTFYNPFIFQSRPLEQQLSSPLPPLSFVPHTVKRGEEDLATNPSIPPLGSDVYNPQVALAQWAEDGDSTIQNLVAPLHLSLSSFVPSAIQTCTTLPIACSLSASNVKFHNPAIIPPIVPTNHHPSITTLLILRLKWLQSYEGDCVMIGHVASWHVHVFLFFLFFFLFLLLRIHARYAWTVS